MRLRVATGADADAILALDRVVAPDGARAGCVREEIEARACHVALVDERVVAYAVLNYRFYGNGWIEMLRVDPRFRRRGIGASLVRHLVGVCRTPKLFTSTNRSNAPMRRLLEALGFVPSGTIDNLDEGDPERVYFRRLR